MDLADPADIIDKAAGLNPATGVGTLRRERPEILRLSQASYRAALHPADPGNLSYVERAALACRMVRLLKDDTLAAHYAGLLDGEGAGSATATLVDPSITNAVDARTNAILRHVDLLTLSPEKATRGDVERLMSAGLTDRDVVTLTGLIAFVNYQARLVVGMRMLKGE
ncbi:CMD domain protein [Microvirga sp. TS319]|uniref:CMD domain protein n=1 Tax=Microvirga sp. TS319 TaxID=3241165 RepID=UPI003519F158